MSLKDKVIIAIVCLALGVVLAIQFRIVQGNKITLLPNQKSTELSNELKKVQDEKENLLRELARLEQKLGDFQNSASKENVLIKNLNEELDRYRIIGGFRDVKGPGIVVTLDNPPKDANFNADVNIVYEYELLLSLINELNAAGAEAVSINDQRLISTSEIRSAGNAININAVPQQPPYIVKAIGNKDTLDGALNQVFGIVSILRDHRYLVSVRKQDDISILKYKDVVKLKYAQPVDAQQ